MIYLINSGCKFITFSYLPFLYITNMLYEFSYSLCISHNKDWRLKHREKWCQSMARYQADQQWTWLYIQVCHGTQITCTCTLYALHTVIIFYVYTFRNKSVYRTDLVLENSRVPYLSPTLCIEAGLIQEEAGFLSGLEGLLGFPGPSRQNSHYTGIWQVWKLYQKKI